MGKFAVFLCILTGRIGIREGCLRQTALFSGVDTCLFLFLTPVKLLYKTSCFCDSHIQNAHKDTICPTLHWKKVLVFYVRCGKIISGFEVWIQFFQSHLNKDFSVFLYSWGWKKAFMKKLNKNSDRVIIFTL